MSWNVGSVLDNMPASLSGVNVDGIILRKITYIEKYVGVTIGSVDISDDYHLPLLNLSMYDTIAFSNADDSSNADKYALGPLRVDKSLTGGASSSFNSAENLRKEAMEMLFELKGGYGFYKANG